jgi:hypothetical protein
MLICKPSAVTHQSASKIGVHPVTVGRTLLKNNFNDKKELILVVASFPLFGHTEWLGLYAKPALWI